MIKEHISNRVYLKRKRANRCTVNVDWLHSLGWRRWKFVCSLNPWLMCRKVMSRKVGRHENARISCKDYVLRLSMPLRRLSGVGLITCHALPMSAYAVVMSLQLAVLSIDAWHSYQEISSGLSVVSWSHWFRLRCDYVVLLRCTDYVVQMAGMATRKSSTRGYSRYAGKL